MEDKRTPITIGLSAAVGAIVASGVLTLSTGEKINVDVYKPTGTTGLLEVSGASKNALTTKLSESGAQGSVRCKLGEAVNEPSKWYCTDGGTAGFLLDAATQTSLVAEVDSKVVGGERAKDEIKIVIGDDGKFYAETEIIKADPVK